MGTDIETISQDSDIYDPWGMLGLEIPSEHHKGKTAKIIAYDHTGYIKAECECGEKYNPSSSNSKDVVW